ncbi:MAG: hypothetical protein O8C61_02450 [Candidatus Methanoperedens sp.]|nr:hypothetical protein [Candidatus Methanoperedens sp.]
MLNRLLAYSIIGGIILGLILTLSGNVFDPSIQLDDIKDVVVGDKITVTGMAKGLDESQVDVILKGANINSMYTIEFIKEIDRTDLDEKFNFGSIVDDVKLDSWDIGDGYKLEAYWKTTPSPHDNDLYGYVYFIISGSTPFRIEDVPGWHNDVILISGNILRIFGDQVGHFRQRYNAQESFFDCMETPPTHAIMYDSARQISCTTKTVPTPIVPYYDSVKLETNSNNIEFNWAYPYVKIRNVLTGKGLHKTINMSNGRFNTFFDTSGLDGGLYQVDVISREVSINKSFNLILANIEDISIIRNSDVFGTPTTVAVSLKNPSNEIKKLNLNLWLDSAFNQMAEVSIPPNSFEITKFNLDNLGVGTHKISVGGHERLIEVKPVPFLKLDSISGDIGIGRDLTITGTSNRPDGTSVLITVKNADMEIARQTTTINNGRFSLSFGTSGYKEGVYTVKADDTNGNSASTTLTFIKLKAALDVVSMSVYPSELIIGESATITASVKNNGNIEGTRNIELKVDGLVRKSKPITIQPNSIREIQFIVKEDVGIHNIEIDGYTTSLIVKVKPAIQLNKISSVRIGQDLIISGTTNIPDNTKILVSAKSGDASLTPQSVLLKDGSISATFTTASAQEGIYTIKAEDSKGTSDTTSVLIFKDTPELSYDLSVSPKDVTPDGTVIASVTIKNNANMVKDVVLNLKIDDQMRQSQTISISPNSIKVVSFEIKNEKVGSHIIDVNGYVTSYSVSAPAPTTVTDISTNELRIQLRSDKTIISKNENIFLTLSAVNKITNTKDVHLQVILVIPSGLSATETSFAKSGVGQYVSDSIIKSGESRTEYINVGVMPNQVGTFTITGEVIYYLGDDRTSGGTQKISVPITVIG